jgi:hypothetical protein
MRVPVWIKPAVWGAVFGAVGIMIVGFSWMGWTLGHTATRLVAEGRESAMVAALTPFCVSNYMKQPDAAKQLALLKEDTSSYTQRDIIEKAGFATMPGNKEPTSGLAAACAIALKTVSLADPERRGTSVAGGANTTTK